MPKTIRFHLDENCDPRIAHGLRRLGIDVTTTPDVGMRNATDQEQLAYAIATGRMIVTQDVGFLRAAAAGTGHPGIGFYAHQSRTVGQVIHSLQLIWEVYEPHEMVNCVEYL